MISQLGTHESCDEILVNKQNPHDLMNHGRESIQAKEIVCWLKDVKRRGFRRYQAR